MPYFYSGSLLSRAVRVVLKRTHGSAAYARAPASAPHEYRVGSSGRMPPLIRFGLYAALLRGAEWAEGELEELTNRVFNVLIKSNKAVNACHRDAIGGAFAKLFGVTWVSASEGSQPILQPTVEPSSRQRKDKVTALIKNAKSWMTAALYAGFGVLEAKKRKDDRLKKRSADPGTALGATATTATATTAAAAGSSASGSRAADAAPGTFIGDAEVAPHAQAVGQSDPTGPPAQQTGQDSQQPGSLEGHVAPAVLPNPAAATAGTATGGPEWS